MVFIAHRGNVNGPNPEAENYPPHILAVLREGWNVEIDLWINGSRLLLGHDCPQHDVDSNILLLDNVWIHAKNIEALDYCIERDLNCFYHNNDDCVLTSRHQIWTYPGKRPITARSIIVMPEKADYVLDDFNICAGICSDYPQFYQDLTK